MLSRKLTVPATARSKLAVSTCEHAAHSREPGSARVVAPRGPERRRRLESSNRRGSRNGVAVTSPLPRFSMSTRTVPETARGSGESVTIDVASTVTTVEVDLAVSTAVTYPCRYCPTDPRSGPLHRGRRGAVGDLCLAPADAVEAQLDRALHRLTHGQVERRPGDDAGAGLPAVVRGDEEGDAVRQDRRPAPRRPRPGCQRW